MSTTSFLNLVLTFQDTKVHMIRFNRVAREIFQGNIFNKLSKSSGGNYEPS